MSKLHVVPVLVAGRVLTLQVDDKDFAELQAVGAIVGTEPGESVAVKAVTPENKSRKVANKAGKYADPA